MTNPLLEKDRRVPDFAAVKPEHFAPAFDAAIEDIRKNAAAIKASPDTPTFENTAEPLESLFFELGRIYRIYSVFASNNSSKAIESLSVPLSLKSTTIGKEIFQDQELATRFKAVYDMRGQLGLDEDQERVLENIYQEFEDSGSFLDDAGKQELNRIDNELIEACNTFKQNNASGANQQAFLVSDERELAGVPDSMRQSMQANVAKAAAGLKPGASDSDREFAAELASSVIGAIQKHEAAGTLDELYLFRPERLMVDDLLSRAESRSFRQNIFEALNRIGTVPPYDNEQPVRDIQRLRQERIAVLNRAREPGDRYADYADAALRQTMAGSLDAVEKLFGEMEAPLLAQFERDIKTLGDFAASKGFAGKLEPWDVPYWTAQYKEETWQFDGNKLSEYFEVNNVISGFLDHISELFGLDFKENTSYSKINEDVKTYDVTDKKTGKSVGILHMDLFARPGKRGGAWATALQQQHGGQPVIAIMNCNLPRPAEGKPALVGAGQVETFFHEGGHDINQLLGTRSRYTSLHGTAHSADFVEIHSMLQERWAFARKVLANYARHYKTGEQLPDALIEAKENSDAFLQSRDPLLLIQNSKRDFLFHSMNPARYKNIADIHEKAALNSTYAPLIRPYPLSRFNHLFDSPAASYAAGYFSYYWADACAEQVFDLFRKKGLYDRVLGDKLKEFYRDGACRKQRQSFRNLTGCAPSSAALLRRFGIAPEEDGNAPAGNARPPEPGMP